MAGADREKNSAIKKLSTAVMAITRCIDTYCNLMASSNSWLITSGYLMAHSGYFIGKMIDV